MPTTARTGCAPSCSSPWTMSATRAAARSPPSRTSSWVPSCAPSLPERAMAVRASVLPQPEPGHAILRLSELDASPDGLTLSIERQQGPDSHLADDGWRRTETWLLPARVERAVGREKGALDFHLGPEICDRLAGIATVRLRVKEPDIGVVGATVVAWPSMLTSGAIDRGQRSLDDVVRLRRTHPETPPPPAPPFEPPKQPPPGLRAAREPMPEMERRSGATGWLVAAAILVLLAGG